MKHRNTTNRTFRTAGATMIALLAISTAACGGSTTIDSAADDTAVEAEAPAADAADAADESASVDQAEQTSDTNDTASTQEAAGESSSDSSSSGASTSSGSSSSNSSSVQSQSEEPAAEEPAAEEPAVEEEPAAEEPAAEEPAAEEPAAEEPAAEEPAAEEPAAEEEPAVAEFLVNIIASNSYSVQVEASVPRVAGSSTKGIASVCLVQYNEYGNALAGPSGMVTVDGVRYPALIAEGCRANDGNYGEYSYRWSLGAQRSVNGSKKDYYDIAIRAEDGRVRVFCHDTTNFRSGFVERNMADYAGRTSLGRCPS